MNLANVKVLDLSRVLAGPFCTMMLGDFGAKVIKIENILGGDDTRKWGPPFIGNDALYFWSVNRNKKSVAVNFKSKFGTEIIRDLAMKSNVLVENFIPGKLKQYGLDYESLKAVNPSLIYCSISGYGQQGPLAKKSGYDIIAAGMGGLLHITGPKNGPPCRVGVAVTDLMTGMMSCNSILAALVQQKTQIIDSQEVKGCHIDCNLLSTQVAMLFHLGANYLTSGMDAERIGTSHSALVPYQAFNTSDNKYFIVCAGNDNQFVKLCEIVGLPELSNDSRFVTNSVRINNRQAIVDILSEKFENHSLAEWENRFSSSSIPHGPVNDIKHVFSNPQVQYHAQNLITKWNTSDGVVSSPGNPIGWIDDKTKSYFPYSYARPPKLGEHTEEVMTDILKYDDVRLKELIDTNSIFIP